MRTVAEPTSIASALRRLRKMRKRYGALSEPVDLPELDDLWLVPILPGETLPTQSTDSALGYYSPDGQPITGALGEVLDQWARARLQPDSQWWSPTFYRAGTRLRVSTVYLGLDHGFGALPLVWESMIFHGGGRGELGNGCQQWRYTTRAAAQAGHVAIVSAIREAQRARRVAHVSMPPRHRSAEPCPG